MRISYWSSDVCSSDLCGVGRAPLAVDYERRRHPKALDHIRADILCCPGWGGLGDEVQGRIVPERAVADDALQPLDLGEQGAVGGVLSRLYRVAVRAVRRPNRKRRWEGQGVVVRVGLGGWRLIQKKKNETIT